MSTLSIYKSLRENGRLESPKLLQVEITDLCPLNCKQCYKDLENSSEMGYEKFKEIIIESSEIGVKSVMLNGGEPLLHSKIVDLIKLATQHGISCTCFTSGLGIDDKFIKSVSELDLTLGISLNGSNKEIHSISRDGFEISLKAMDILKRNGIEYFINWVARNDNVEDIESLIELAKTYGAKYINIVANKLTANGDIDSPLTVEDCKTLKNIIIDPKNAGYLNIQSCYNKLGVYCYDGKIPPMSGCNAGRTFCAITKDGSFMPCTHLFYKENKYSSIAEYWNESNILKDLISGLDGKNGLCGKCKYKSRCRNCSAMLKESHDNFNYGIENCPVYCELQKVWRYR